jgi:hypothetical protein
VKLENSEHRVYELINQALSTSDPGELEEVMTELRAALKEHMRLTKAIALTTLSYLSSAETRD